MSRLVRRRVLLLAIVASGAVYASARFDLQWAPPVAFHSDDPALAPLVLVDRTARSPGIGDVVLYRFEGEPLMGEVLTRAEGEIRLIAPGYPPWAMTVEIPEDDVTGRVLIMFGDWD